MPRRRWEDRRRSSPWESLGSHSSQHRRYQFFSPSSFITEGSSTARTIVASSRTATDRPNNTTKTNSGSQTSIAPTPCVANSSTARPPRTLVVLGLAATGRALLALAAARTPWQVLTAVAGTGPAFEIYEPATSELLARVTRPSGDRTRTRSWARYWPPPCPRR